MGFVAEELNETERLSIQRNKVDNMALVYGKEASMWKVGRLRNSNSMSNLIHFHSGVFLTTPIYFIDCLHPGVCI